MKLKPWQWIAVVAGLALGVLFWTHGALVGSATRDVLKRIFPFWSWHGF